MCVREREVLFVLCDIYTRARVSSSSSHHHHHQRERFLYSNFAGRVCREKREQNARENKEEKEEKSRPRKVLLLRARAVVKKVFFSSRAFESIRASRETSGVERYNILFFRKI